jgi:cytochrome c peroxidase
MKAFLKRSSLIGAGLAVAAASLILAQRQGLGLPGRSRPGERTGAGTAVRPPAGAAATAPQPSVAAGPPPPPPPFGLPPVSWPEDNPYTPEKAALGAWLFFDKRLSSDGSVSCASCHDPSRAFTDGRAHPVGIGGQEGRRNAPTLINRAYSTFQFWDGRARSLEEQAREPIANPAEMTCEATTELAHARAVERLKAIPAYVARFQSVFGPQDFSIDHVARALATFERTLLSGNSPFDRYVAGDATALAPAQVRGLGVFVKKAACDRCHLGPYFIADLFYEHDDRSLRGRRIRTDPVTGREVPEIQGFNFTDGSFQNTGVGSDQPEPDLGRWIVNQRAEDRGAFKTPTLREIEHTAPYMHDGSLKTLEDVVEYYDQGGIRNPNLQPLMAPLKLTTQEKQDLVAFLKGLSGQGWQQIQAPADLPP